MTRLSTYCCTTLVIALANAPLHGLGAQQIRPAAVVTSEQEEAMKAFAEAMQHWYACEYQLKTPVPGTQ